MKKIVTIEKKLDFPSMIGEITSISLDHNLKVISDCEITGEFKVSGTYKLTEASRLEDTFDYSLPVDILLNEKLEEKTIKIAIDDFTYEIENDEVMICQIKVMIEGVEKIEDEKEEIIDDIRECDGEKLEEKEIEIPTMNNEKEIIEEETAEEFKPSIFSSLDNEDSYKTYSVYVIRDGETIDNILNKYKVTKEELEAYNDLNNIGLGSKIIIPTNNE